MDRLQALVALCEGKAIRNRTWNNRSLRLKMVDGYLCWIGSEFRHEPYVASEYNLESAAICEAGYEVVQ